MVICRVAVSGESARGRLLMRFGMLLGGAAALAFSTAGEAAHYITYTFGGVFTLYQSHLDFATGQPVDQIQAVDGSIHFTVQVDPCAEGEVLDCVTATPVASSYVSLIPGGTHSAKAGYDSLNLNYQSAPTQTTAGAAFTFASPIDGVFPTAPPPFTSASFSYHAAQHYSEQRIYGRPDYLTAEAFESDGPITLGFVFGQLTPVPEPTTWAMMIAGFGIVGGAMRRRNAAVAYG